MMKNNTERGKNRIVFLVLVLMLAINSLVGCGRESEVEGEGYIHNEEDSVKVEVLDKKGDSELKEELETESANNQEADKEEQKETETESTNNQGADKEEQDKIETQNLESTKTQNKKEETKTETNIQNSNKNNTEKNNSEKNQTQKDNSSKKENWKDNANQKDKAETGLREDSYSYITYQGSGVRVSI